MELESGLTTGMTASNSAQAQKPISLSDLQDSLAAIKAIEPSDSVLWVNQATMEILKAQLPRATGPRSRHLMDLEIYIDESVPYRTVESGVWARMSDFKEGESGRMKSVRHRYMI
jgi:hypothetical protein